MITAEQIRDEKIYTQMGMTDDEFALAEKLLGRLPNYTELGLFSVMWSEHCSYKNSKVLLRRFPTEGECVLQGPGEGAGIVDIGDGLAAVFKIESHNHPSAVAPFAGAATGVGGIVRDVFSMGARPVALLNSLRFGELEDERTKYLFREVAAGMANYGNGIEVPTVAGEICFDPCYGSNPLVNAMCVGILRHEDIKKGIAIGEGNSVIYAGAATGRDGIHGATFASTELDDESQSKEASVPTGDPQLEKRLMEACLALMNNPALVGIQDMGAAGLISSSSEMASKGGMGIRFTLDHVPQREENMSPYEMMLSESQERMLLVVKRGQEAEIIKIFEEYDIAAVCVGEVISRPHIELYYKGELVADVPADALAKAAPEYHKPSREAAYYKEFAQVDTNISEALNHGETLLALLACPTIASKAWVYEQFDYNAGGNTLVNPGAGGIVQVAGTNKALSMTVDCNARYVYLDPYVGGAIAVAESARNLVCTGAKPLAVTDNLNFGSPENPEIFWQMEQSTDGISAACIALNTPVIGGNVSMYNERGASAIYPTPTIGMVGLIDDLAHVTTPGFKQAGDYIYLLGETKAEFGGSELQKLQNKGRIFGRPPGLDLQVEKKAQEKVLSAIGAGLVQSAQDLSEGGLAVCLAECAIQSGGLGANVNLEGNMTAALFSESQSRFLISVAPEKKEAFESLTGACPIGEVTKDGALSVFAQEQEVFSLPVEQLKSVWGGAIECLLK